MKHWLIPVLLLLAAVLMLQSCDKKNCDDVVCPGVYTYCDRGNCFCLPGYEGPNCDEQTRDKYFGQFRVTESCTTSSGGFQNNQFTAFITPVSNRVDLLNIDNFTIYGGSVIANIIDATTLYIDEQPAGAINFGGGQGFYQEFNNTFRLEYNYTVSGNFHSCTANYVRF